MPTSLTSRTPVMTGEQIVASLVPPPQFSTASFDSYIPDEEYPSQAQARDTLDKFSSQGNVAKAGKLFGRRQAVEDALPGVYLDGGFGVGKTHLLAALWHANPGRKKFFGTFLQYTSLVGALGYQQALEALKGASIICIDEFELDDPGDTMLMTRLLGELVSSGTRVAATSNTPPHALGEGRFAAADFLREIHALASNFETLRIDGTDYRKRTAEGAAAVVTATELDQDVAAVEANGGAASLDDFAAVLRHLATVHPSTYVRLIADLDLICLTDVTVMHNQTDALRFVAFMDRVYDAQVPVRATGVPLSEVFGGDMINGGYRKKYLRCVSRVIALTHSSPA